MPQNYEKILTHNDCCIYVFFFFFISISSENNFFLYARFNHALLYVRLEINITHAITYCIPGFDLDFVIEGRRK